MQHTHSLIIGATTGIGRPLISRFADQGHRVSVTGLSAPDELLIKNDQVAYFFFNMMEDEQLEGAIRDITEQNGPVRNLVFFQRYRGEDPWHGEIDMSLSATKKTIESLTDSNMMEEDASIVLVNSIASTFIAEEQDIGYHVAKAGMRQMGRYYATTLGPQRIRVNSVSFGAIIKEESRTYYEQNTDVTELNGYITPLGRMGTSEDVADVITFLCSPQSSFITGHDLVVDGGLSLKWQGTLAQNIRMKYKECAESAGVNDNG